MAEDVLSSSAPDIVALYQSRQVSSVEILTATLDRIDRLDRFYNAFVMIDRQGALHDAQAHWPIEGTIPGRCRPTSDTAISNTRCATPRCRRNYVFSAKLLSKINLVNRYHLLPHPTRDQSARNCRFLLVEDDRCSLCRAIDWQFPTGAVSNFSIVLLS